MHLSLCKSQGQPDAQCTRTVAINLSHSWNLLLGASHSTSFTLCYAVSSRSFHPDLILMQLVSPDLRPWLLHPFLMATINMSPQTNLKQPTFILLQLWRSEFQHGSCWAEIGAGGRGRDIFLLEAPRKTLFPCLFQLLDGAHMLWLLAPSSTFKVRNGESCPSHLASS